MDKETTTSVTIDRKTFARLDRGYLHISPKYITFIIY